MIKSAKESGHYPFGRHLGGGQDQLPLPGKASPCRQLVRLHPVTRGHGVDRRARLQRLCNRLRLNRIRPPPVPVLKKLYAERSEKRTLSIHCETHSHLEMGITSQAPPGRATCGSTTALMSFFKSFLMPIDAPKRVSLSYSPSLGQDLA